MKKITFAVCFSILSVLMVSMACADIMTTVAGNCTTALGNYGDGGPAVEACLATPFDVTFDDKDNYYIADHSNNLVRKVDKKGIITTVAGGGSSLASGINALDASLARPTGLAFFSQHGKDYLYIADRDNLRACVLDIKAGKIYTVFSEYPFSTGGIRPVVINKVLYLYLSLSSGMYSGKLAVITMTDPVTPGTMTDLYSSTGIAHLITYTEGRKTYLVMNEYWAGKVSRFDISSPLAPAGYTVIAGGGSDTADTVAATSAFLVEPFGIVRDKAGNIYISEHDFWSHSSGNRVRRIAPDGIMTTVAGMSGVYGFIGDGGPATEATFYCPTGLTMDRKGNLYIGDDWNHRIRKVTNP